MSRHAFVTGATGFVGGHLVRELCQQGWQVTALVRQPSALEKMPFADVTVCKGDVTDADSVRKAMPDQADAVFHVAASTSIWSRNNAEQQRINVDGTRHLLRAACDVGIKRFIHTSSFVVWGFQQQTIDENSPQVSDGAWINYIRTKRAAEALVKEVAATGKMEAVILNPAHILGPGDRHNWSRMIRLVQADALPGVPPGGGAFADVREVAKAHVQAFEHGKSGHNYLLGGPDTRFLDVIRMTGELLGKPVPKRASPAFVLHLAGRLQVLAAHFTGRAPDLTPEGAAMITRHIHCDSSRAQSELAYGFTPVRTLLIDTIEWMRAQGELG